MSGPSHYSPSEPHDHICPGGSGEPAHVTAGPHSGDILSDVERDRVFRGSVKPGNVPRYKGAPVSHSHCARHREPDMRASRARAYYRQRNDASPDLAPQHEQEHT